VIRVVAGAAILGGGAVVARQGLDRIETDVFRLVTDLSGVLAPVLIAVMQFGSFVAVPAAAPHLGRRMRRGLWGIRVGGRGPGVRRGAPARRCPGRSGAGADGRSGTPSDVVRSPTPERALREALRPAVPGWFVFRSLHRQAVI
jgi:hypothetical protein